MAEIYRRLHIKRGSLGQLLSEQRIKEGLTALCPDLFFDLATKIDKWHPEIDYCQGVYYNGYPEGQKHICSMDRGWMLQGMCSEVPVWTTAPDLVEVPHDEITPQEIANQPPGLPAPCLHDENLWQVIREERQELILVGWRYVFRQLIKRHIPGITVPSLKAKFRVNMDCYVEDPFVTICTVENESEPWKDETVEEGKIWEDMGLYEAKPTVVLTDKGT